jgi:uncharacterized protein YukE
MEKDINYEKLSAYLDGELSPEEKGKFEEEIALSSDLQKKLAELRKLKQLTASSLKPLSESPYLETKLFASLKEHKTSFFTIKRLSPIAGFLVLTLAVMIFLKYNPQVIENLVERQKSNLAGFYKQNLKPLLYAANLTNEDIFNFAFNHQLPLDKTNSQYLQLGYGTTGNGFFEIKTGNIASNANNLDKFIKVLNLNSQQKEKVDSILQNYAEDLQSQVLVNDKNTVAINPNIWNYNKAVLADIIAFANNANKEEFSKICPVGLTSYDKNSIVNAINVVKKTRDNQYIFFTPDTIFSGNYEFDKGKYKDEMKKMKEEMKKASYEWKKYAINLQLDNSIIKLKNDPSWGKNFNVQFDGNTCRVNLQNIVPGLELPDFDSITVQIERAADLVEHITVNIPRMTMNIPDSIMNQNKYFSHKFFGSGKRGQMNLDSILANIRSMIPDSISNFNGEEYKIQMKEFQKEMKKFQQQMKDVEKELKKDKKEQKEKNDPIEI